MAAEALWQQICVCVTCTAGYVVHALLAASFITKMYDDAGHGCRDTVQLYEQLYESGLQYGPAFRLLRNVHVPDTQ